MNLLNMLLKHLMVNSSHLKKKKLLVNKPFSTVPMFITSRLNTPAGPFNSHLVVSYRRIKKNDLEKAIKITSKHRISHGAPVYCGFDYEKQLGIKNLQKPDFLYWIHRIFH